MSSKATCNLETHAHTHACTHTHAHAHTHMHTHTRTHTHTHTHTRTQEGTYTYTQMHADCTTHTHTLHTIVNKQRTRGALAKATHQKNGNHLGCCPNSAWAEPISATVRAHVYTHTAQRYVEEEWSLHSCAPFRREQLTCGVLAVQKQ